MSRPVHAYAALLMPDSGDLDPGQFLRLARDVLAIRDCPAKQAPPLVSTRRRRTAGETLDLAVRVQDDHPGGSQRIVIEARPFHGAPYLEEHGAQVLSDFILAAFEMCDAPLVEWDSPDVVLNRSEFIELRRYVSPRRASAPTHDPQPETPKNGLDRCAHKSEGRQLPRHSLSSWGDADHAPTPPAPRRAETLSASPDQKVDDDLERRLIRRFCIELEEDEPHRVISSRGEPAGAHKNHISLRKQARVVTPKALQDGQIPDTPDMHQSALTWRIAQFLGRLLLKPLRFVPLRFAAQIGTVAMLFVALQTTDSLGAVLALVLP